MHGSITKWPFTLSFSRFEKAPLFFVGSAAKVLAQHWRGYRNTLGQNLARNKLFLLLLFVVTL